MIARYRKKPVVVEAVQFNGENYAEVHELMAGAPPAIEHEAGKNAWDFRVSEAKRLGFITIPTLEGEMNAKPGDWIIKGTAGEVYPCKADIFVTIYEPAK